MIGGWLERQRRARGEFVEAALAVEIGSRGAECDPRAAEHRRTAAEIILAQDRRLARVPGVAPADRQAELLGEVEGRIAEHRKSRGVDIGFGKGGQPGKGVEDADVEQGVGGRVEIIEAEQTFEAVAFIEQLEFLADLFVEVKAGDVDIDRGQRVEIDRGRRRVLAPGADRAERQRVGQFGGDIHRQTVGFDFLLRIVQAAAAVEDIVEHRRVGAQRRDQAVAAARRALVLGIVARNADQDGLAVAAKFDGAATGPDILVIIFQAGGEIVAEAAARQPRDRTADADDVADRCAGGDDEIGLVIGA